MKCTVTKYPVSYNRPYYIKYGESFDEERFHQRYLYAILYQDELEIIDSLAAELEPDEYLEVSP